MAGQLILENASSVTQKMCDDAQGDSPHVLIAIGHLGQMTCYLDVPLANAKARYAAEYGAADPDPEITVFGFTDSFSSYEVSMMECAHGAFDDNRFRGAE